MRDVNLEMCDGTATVRMINVTLKEFFRPLDKGDFTAKMFCTE